MMDFEQNFWKKYIWINLQNHPSDQPILAKRKNLQCELSSIWMNASNEEEISESFSFIFWLLLKTPYSFDTRGILSTPAWVFLDDWKWQLNNKVIRKRSWQTIKEDNSTKHLKGQQFLFTKICIESEVSMKILSHE